MDMQMSWEQRLEQARYHIVELVPSRQIFNPLKAQQNPKFGN